MKEYKVVMCRISTLSFVEGIHRAGSPSKAVEMAIDCLPEEDWTWICVEAVDGSEGKTNATKEALRASRRRKCL